MQSKNYPLSMLLSTETKTLSGLCGSIGISSDILKRELHKNPIETKEIVEICKKVFVGKKIKAIADDVILFKEYAECIEGVQLHYYPGKRIHVKAHCIVVIALSDGITTIPIAFKLYMAKGNYKKTDLLIQLLTELREQIEIDMVLADGHYSTVKMLTWLVENKMKFEMRMHSNRRVARKGEECQVRFLKNLKPKGKRKCRTVMAAWYGLDLYLTAVKHVKRDGSFMFKYQVSNYKSSANEHIMAYKKRWPIEKFFRTGKQKLGLQDCVMRKFSDHTLHIMNVFYAYMILQLEVRYSRTFSFPEEVIRHYRSKNSQHASQRISALGRNFGWVHA